MVLGLPRRNDQVGSALTFPDDFGVLDEAGLSLPSQIEEHEEPPDGGRTRLLVHGFDELADQVWRQVALSWALAIPRSLRLARGNSWTRQWLLFGRRANRWEQNPERAARRAVFRLASRAMPKPIREVLWLLRGLRLAGLRQR